MGNIVNDEVVSVIDVCAETNPNIISKISISYRVKSSKILVFNFLQLQTFFHELVKSSPSGKIAIKQTKTLLVMFI
jgi:hypothetical protein